VTNHVLYRFFNATGQLLYIGITMNPPQRFRDHRESKEWWTEVAGITVENYPNRTALADAERRAIKVEHPLHNVTHNNAHPMHNTASAISDENPVGIRDYWIGDWTRIPQWQKLAQLLNDIALEAYEYNIQGNQDNFSSAVDCLIRGIAYMDCCPECEEISNGTDTSAAPYVVSIEDGWLEGKYMCCRGHKWKCWHSIHKAAWR
jgi:predicted GIY-YIG superfamily endonuclease